jgi:hypothetical protein
METRCSYCGIAYGTVPEAHWCAAGQAVRNKVYDDDIKNKMESLFKTESLRPSESRLLKRLMQILSLEPCNDHSCTQRTIPISGMGTNGGCRCANNVESAVFDLTRIKKNKETEDGA